MPKPQLFISHRHVTFAARAGALSMAIALVQAYATGGASEMAAVWLAGGLMVSLLVGIPTVRSGDLIGSAAVWITAVELALPAASGHVHFLRWLVAMAVGGALVLIFKLQGWRSTARANPYGELGRERRRRRGGVAGRAQAAVRIRFTS
jgi:hypothetical protein